MADAAVRVTSVEWHPNLGEFRALTTANGIVGRATTRAAEKTKSRARDSINHYGRVRTGYMRDRSLHAKFVRSSGYVAECAVWSDAPYAVYQHQGTSRGITPAPFLTEALNRLTARDFE